MTSLRHHRRGFWSVAFAFMAVMAFSTVPSPLYGLYQQADGFSSFTVTVVYGAYAIGVVGALFLAGHLSDSRGRRRVLLLAIAASAVSALGFLLWHDLAGLLAARIVNGASVGVVTATATVYLAELYAAGRPGADPGRPQLVATAVNLGGLGLGPLVSGALAEWAPDPLRLPFLVFLGLLGAALLVVALAPETRPAAVPPPPYRTQRVALPPGERREFLAAAAGAFVAFGALGLFNGLAGTFLADTFAEHSHLLAGLAVFLIFWGGVAAQVATSAWAPRRVLAAGFALMLAGLVLSVAGAWLPSPSLGLFLAGGAVGGAGAGAVIKGTVGRVAALAPPGRRAETLAALFLAGYLGLSVPVVGAGVALLHLSARATLLLFALAVAAGILAAAPRLLGRPPRRPGSRPAPAMP